MRHLFLSAVRVERMQLTNVGGRAVMAWDTSPEPGAAFLKCRLDLNFLRPGKDIPSAPVAGRAPDRIGVMFCDANAPIKAGDRIVTIANEYGQMDIEGTFEIRAIPDKAISYTGAHHIEVQIIETVQALDGVFPSNEIDLS